MERRVYEAYEFGNFRFNPTERYLQHNGEAIALTPKALDTLLALVSRSGHLVTKEELLKEVWKDAFVEEATIVQNVSTLRKALSRDGANNGFIETVPKRGYRFVATVKTCRDERVSLPASENLGVETAAEIEVPAERAIAPIESQTNAGDESREVSNPSRVLPWKRLAYVVGGLLALATLALALVVARNFRQNPVTTNTLASFEKMSFVKTTQTGKVRTSAISPDGKYVAYVALDAGKQSLWIRQVSAPNDAQIMGPANVQYLGLTFSLDGNYVFFVSYENGKNEGVLYRIPAIGGAPQVVIRDIDSPVTFSPDGKQLAFVRGYLATRETALLIANTDGTGEQKIASRFFPAFFPSEGPAWSPKGIIACGVRSPDPAGISETIVSVDPKTREEKSLTDQKWAEVGRLSWDKGGTRLILTAAQALAPHQLWQISWPDGLAHRMTNDLTDYQGVSLASSVSALSTVQTEANTRIWVTQGPQYQAIELAPTRNDGLRGIAWTPDDRLVFTCFAGGRSDLWTMDADGRGKKPITNDDRIDFLPTVTRDGRFLIYSSSEEGRPANVWRTNIDGSSPRQLTFGNDDRGPTISLDGKWVFYSSFNLNKEKRTYDETLWKVSIDGGDSSQVVNQISSAPLISPDGKLIAYRHQPAPDQPWKVRVVSYDTGELIKELLLPVPVRSTLQWAPDSRGLTYVETRDGVSNVWSLALSGGAPKQVTHFDSGQIFRYAWSSDGKRLALVRGVQNGDVVLIRDFG